MPPWLGPFDIEFELCVFGAGALLEPGGISGPEPGAVNIQKLLYKSCGFFFNKKN